MILFFFMWHVGIRCFTKIYFRTYKWLADIYFFTAFIQYYKFTNGENSATIFMIKSEISDMKKSFLVYKLCNSVTTTETNKENFKASVSNNLFRKKNSQ